MKPYVEPTSLSEAERRYDEEKLRLQDIEAQLSDRNKISAVTGQRMMDVEFWEWHGRAVYAKKCTLETMTRLKAYIREHRAERDDVHVAMLRKVASILDDVEDLAPDEMETREQLRTWLQTRSA